MIIADRYSPPGNAERLSGYSLMSVREIPAAAQLNVWATFSLLNIILSFPNTSLDLSVLRVTRVL